MIYLDFENVDFSFLLEDHSVVAKNFVCLCSYLKKKTFTPEHFLKILGKDFGGLGIDSKEFHSIYSKQEITGSGGVVLTAFSNQSLPNKIGKKSNVRFGNFKMSVELLSKDVIVRSIVGRFVQKTHMLPDMPYYDKKVSKHLKIELITEQTFFDIVFTGLVTWDFFGKFAKFKYDEFTRPSKKSISDFFRKNSSNSNYAYYLISSILEEAKEKYDPWVAYSELIDSDVLEDKVNNFVVSLFFTSLMFLIENNLIVFDEPEDAEKKEKIVVKEKQKSNKVFIAKDNPKFRPDERAIFNYWNTKNLRKHKDGTSKIIQSFMTYYRKPEKYFTNIKDLNLDLVKDCIDKFEQMVNDPDTQPINPATKKYLRGFGLNDFFYHYRTNRSMITEIAERGVSTRVKPYSSEMFDKVCTVVQRGMRGLPLTPRTKNIIATFTNKVVVFLDSEKTRLIPGNSYTKIACESLKNLFKGKGFNLLFIVSENFYSDYLPKFCTDYGYLKPKSEITQQTVYTSVVNKLEKASRDVLDESESLKMMKALRKGNENKTCRRRKS